MNMLRDFNATITILESTAPDIDTFDAIQVKLVLGTEADDKWDRVYVSEDYEVTDEGLLKIRKTQSMPEFLMSDITKVVLMFHRPNLTNIRREYLVGTEAAKDPYGLPTAAVDVLWGSPVSSGSMV